MAAAKNDFDSTIQSFKGKGLDSEEITLLYQITQADSAYRNALSGALKARSSGVNIKQIIGQIEVTNQPNRDALTIAIEKFSSFERIKLARGKEQYESRIRSSFVYVIVFSMVSSLVVLGLFMFVRRSFKKLNRSLESEIGRAHV